MTTAAKYTAFGGIRRPFQRWHRPADGAGKSRWIYFPPGAAIDGTDADAWVFTAGVKLRKEFAWNGVKVETRFIWKASETEWVFAAYVWRADGSDADLAPPEGIPAYNEVAPGKRHDIPGVEDCKACHEAGRARVLGFNALQLSPDRDPLASLGLALRQPAAHDGADPVAATAVGRPGRYTLPGAAPGTSLRIAPGDPARSSLLYRLASRRPSSQMPPLGTVLVDREAVELIREWIAEDLAPGR